MPIPEKVSPYNYQVHQLIYNDGHFSIAWGQCQDKTMRIAMRWNGDDDGYPQAFGNPAWFQLPEYLSLLILKGILELDSSHSEEIMKVIRETDWEKWDRQIEKDAESGKLDFLIEEALSEKNRVY